MPIKVHHQPDRPPLAQPRELSDNTSAAAAALDEPSPDLNG